MKAQDVQYGRKQENHNKVQKAAGNYYTVIKSDALTCFTTSSTSCLNKEHNQYSIQNTITQQLSGI